MNIAEIVYNKFKKKNESHHRTLSDDPSLGILFSGYVRKKILHQDPIIITRPMSTMVYSFYQGKVFIKRLKVRKRTLSLVILFSVFHTKKSIVPSLHLMIGVNSICP